MQTKVVPRTPVFPKAPLDVESSISGRKLRANRDLSFEGHLDRNTIRETRESQLHDLVLSNYAVGLEQRINFALQKQNSWYDGIEREIGSRQAKQENILQEVRSNWTRHVEANRREQDEQERQQRDLRELQRVEREKFRWLEQEHIQKQKNEAEEAARIRSQRLRECIVCLENYDLDIMSELACHHWYCAEHIQEAFRVAWTSRRPFQCCQQLIPIDSIPNLFPISFQADYTLWLEERATENPLYCFDHDCSVFLPLRLSEGPDTIRCHRCRKVTCRHCRRAFHQNQICAADPDARAVKEIASAKGWKACPSCSQMIEKQSGCVHMTCRCGTDFCYRCGRLYSICPGSC